ncbi:MAG TPA: ABC transporter ATP-binding protein [Chloroflexia bacterium]|jgi:lipopolysaccharide transport system ATP-binding protein
MSSAVGKPEQQSILGPDPGNGQNGASNGHKDSAPATQPVAHSRASNVSERPLKVIKFSKVSKRFILRHERPRSFQDMLVSLFGLRTLSRRGVAMPRPANEEFWALRDVNFSIYAGEAVGIIGENGSGKSTTLKLVSRILEPTSGSVSVRGKVSALLELGTGFHPELTGRENIFLNGSLLGLSRKEMAARYDKIVDFSEIGEFIDTPIKHYSSGMVMRLGFAVAINVDPDILLTDEVLAVGDEAFQRKCLDYISMLRRRGVTIVFVSHALDAVRSLCSRAIWLDHGRMIADGPAGSVVDRYLAYENEKHTERLKAEQDNRPVNMPAAPTVPEAMETVEDDEEMLPQEAATEPSQAGPPPHAPRADVKITGITFVDGSGASSQVFRTDEPLTIRLHFHAHDRVEDPIFGVAIYTEGGTHVNGPNTRFAGLPIPAIEGTGHVDYHIERLPLLAGRYFVTVAVTGSEMTDILDHQFHAGSFVVQPTPSVAERMGLVLIPAQWSVHPDTEA